MKPQRNSNPYTDRGRREWWPTPVFTPGKSQGQRSMAGYCPRDCRVGHDWATNTLTKERGKKTKWLENRIHRKHLCLKEGVTFAWVLQWIAAHLILWGLQRGASFAQCVMMWLVWDMLTGQRRGEPQNPVKLSRKWSVEKRQWWKSGAGNRPRNDELFKRKPRN